MDFNARSTTHADYVEEDTDHLHVLPGDYQTDVPMQRMSEDKGFNNFGSSLLDFCKLTGFRIVSGRVGQDRGIGKCTYVGSMGQSLVDYVLASQSLLPAICTFKVDDPNSMSDHCLIQFSELAVAKQQDDDDKTGTALKFEYIWDNTRAESYRTTLESEEIKVRSFHKFKNGVMESVCAPLFKRNIKHTTDEYTFNESKQPWFSNKCREKTSLFYRHLNIHGTNKHDCVLRRNMVNARSEYKKQYVDMSTENHKQKSWLINQTENVKIFGNVKIFMSPSSSSEKGYFTVVCGRDVPVGVPLVPISFFLNDIESVLIQKGAEGFDIGMLKL